MQRRYTATSNMGGSVMAATAKTVISNISATSIRPYLYDWTFGTTGTPSDSVMTVTVTRATTMTAGTSSTTVVANPLDSIDAAATSTSAGAWTTEPTIGVILFQVGLNVRATYRWVAAPGGELVSPATAAAGLALRTLSPAYVLDAAGVIYFAE